MNPEIRTILDAAIQLYAPLTDLALEYYSLTEPGNDFGEKCNLIIAIRKSLKIAVYTT